MASLTLLAGRRATAPLSKSTISSSTTQVRHASLLKRPHRPYTFTQLITLSDGSSYTQRTTSPAPIYKSTKDSRNHILWQPSMASLRNIEEDEAGRLKAFREKFGRGWDAEEVSEDGEVVEEQENYFDLISTFKGNVTEEQMKGKIATKDKKK